MARRAALLEPTARRGELIGVTLYGEEVIPRRALVVLLEVRSNPTRIHVMYGGWDRRKRIWMRENCEQV